MKRFLLAVTLFTVLSLSNNNTLQAQGVNISVNIGNQPAWGPVGYDYAAYYYFPDIDIYYDVNNSFFYFFDRGAWRSARYLPYSYSNYDLYSMYKVVINDPSPWRYHDRYRVQYAGYRGNRNQVIIMNSPDRRYDRVRNNRVVWVNPNRPNNRPGNNGGYNNNRPGYNGSNNRPNQSKPNDKFSGNNSRPNNQPGYNGNNRPNNNQSKPNDKFSGNNSRPNNNQSGYNGSNNRPNQSKPNDKYTGDNARSSSRKSESQKESTRSSQRVDNKQERTSSRR